MTKTEMVLMASRKTETDPLKCQGKCKKIELVHSQQCINAFTLGLTALSKPEMDSPPPLWILYTLYFRVKTVVCLNHQREYHHE